MTGSKTTSMTIEEMQAARARGESKTDWARIRREQAAGSEPARDAESPDATAAMRETIARHRAGCPVGSGTKDWLKTHSPA